MTAAEMERRRRFFYAEADAGLYDVSIEWVVPYYALLHETLLAAMARAAANASIRDEPFTVLDVGAGTGSDSLAILRAFPNAEVVSLDLCRPMLDELERRLARDPLGADLRRRCRVVHGDVLADFRDPAELVALLPEDRRCSGYAAVLSSLTIHHFEHEEKLRWYKNTCEALAPGGYLAVADLFSHIDPEFSQSWLAYDLNWIRRHFDAPKPNEPGATMPSGDRERLRDAWIAHYDTDNRLEPIESASGLVGQAEMMRDVGFRHVALLYRFSLSGLLVGQR